MHSCCLLVGSKLPSELSQARTWDSSEAPPRGRFLDPAAAAHDTFSVSITIRARDAEGTIKETSDLATVPGLLAAGAHLWIDAEGLEASLSSFLTSVLKLHPLAAEDIIEDQENPKVEDYGDYLYIVALPPGAVGDLTVEGKGLELDIVLGESWVFTHHRGPCQAVEGVLRDLARQPRSLQRGPAFLAHALLDHLVDDYLPVMDRLDDQVEALEAEVVENPSRDVLQRLFRLKRGLQRLRRTAVHQREILQRLARGEFERIPADALPFFRDVFDHFVRVGDLADSYRELLSNDLDAYLSVVSNRMNEVMKTLTIVSTVLLPMNFLVGVYGMNFVNMPELHWRFGYLYFWGLLAVVLTTTLVWLRRRRWI
jgi:magnesium transporter